MKSSDSDKTPEIQATNKQDNTATDSKKSDQQSNSSFNPNPTPNNVYKYKFSLGAKVKPTPEGEPKSSLTAKIEVSGDGIKPDPPTCCMQ